MFYKKQGFPESGEIVLCVVKRILHNSIFVDLEEYDNKEGIIHISEIAPGRIRSIGEYVKVGKKIVCKVLRINQVHGNIELSLRRVNVSARMKKNEDAALEQKAEKIIEHVAQTIKTPALELYKKIIGPIAKEHGSLHACFEEVVSKGESVLTQLGVEKQVAEKLGQVIRQRIKPPEIRLAKIISVKCSAPDGVIRIKGALKEGMEYAKKKEYDITATYLGSPRYRFIIKSTDYKKANAGMDDLAQFLTSAIQKAGGSIDLVKEK